MAEFKGRMVLSSPLPLSKSSHTVVFRSFVQELLDAVGRDGEGDPGGDLHGVYTDDLPVLECSTTHS